MGYLYSSAHSECNVQSFVKTFNVLSDWHICLFGDVDITKIHFGCEENRQIVNGRLELLASIS